MAIAIQNVTNAVEPGRVIVLTPFKLHVFEWAKALTTKFRDPRTAYVSTDKAMFQTRYNQILGIETAIKGRIPP
jgi:regulator of protease activity HflC (stomatin/prohibitin superfamily)